MDEVSFTIEIPCDDDGFVLLQCPECGELFKLRPEDYESDGVLDVRCPSCGMVSDGYLTEDVIELAMVMASNYAQAAMHQAMKELERKVSNEFLTIKAGKPPRPDDEPVLQPSVDALSVTACQHCGMVAKVSRLLKMSVYVCPYCGVTNFNER